MSPRKSKRASVDRAKYKDYLKVAESFHSGAETARAFEYWNAAGLLIVHAAIAYTDAITIKIGGVKSHGEDHMAAVDLVKQTVVLDKSDEKALNHLSQMIQEKNLVSYSGEVYGMQDIEKLWKHLDRYKSWVILVLER